MKRYLLVLFFLTVVSFMAVYLLCVLLVLVFPLGVGVLDWLFAAEVPTVVQPFSEALWKILPRFSLLISLVTPLELVLDWSGFKRAVDDVFKDESA